MEVHQLRYFVAVVQAGGFSRAAEAVRVAQPSLSQQIRKLEAEVGHSLFDRFARRTSLTEAGHKLLPFARRILGSLHDAQRCLDEGHAALAGTVTVGIIPTVAPYIVHGLLQALAAAHPGVAVQVREDTTEPLVRALEHGDLDMTIVSTCRNTPGTQRECWLEEPLLMMLPAAHPAAKKRWACLEALRREPFLSLDEGHCLSQQIERWCRQQKIRRRVALPAVQITTLVAMVAAGQGISLLPAMAIPREQDRGCVFLGLRASAPRREINVLRNPARYQSQAAAAVSALARRTVSEVVAAGQALLN